MSRLEKFFGLILAVLIIGVLVIGAFLWQQSRLTDQLVETGAQDVELPVQTGAIDRQAIGETALLAYGMALEQAQAWQDDAVLVSGRATWPIIEKESELSGGKESWEFTFYSAEAEAAANATVVNGQVTLGQPRGIEKPLLLHQSGGWQLNSPAVVEQFLDSAGREFLAAEKYVSVSMNVDMSTTTESGRPEIMIAAVNIQNGNSLNLWLDATSGEIIDIHQDN